MEIILDMFLSMPEWFNGLIGGLLARPTIKTVIRLITMMGHLSAITLFMNKFPRFSLGTLGLVGAVTTTSLIMTGCATYAETTYSGRSTISEGPFKESCPDLNDSKFESLRDVLGCVGKKWGLVYLDNDSCEDEKVVYRDRATRYKDCVNAEEFRIIHNPVNSLAPLKPTKQRK